MGQLEYSWRATNTTIYNNTHTSTDNNNNINNNSDSITVQSILIELTQFFKFLFTRLKAYTKETVEHLILAIILYLLVCIFLYFAIIKWKLFNYTTTTTTTNRMRGDIRRVLIVIAHPDDECMFFGPTVLNLLKTNQSQLYLMCLSTGQNYGMGRVRKQELYKSCRILGIKDSYITICNHTQLPDRIDCKWPIEIVSKLILNHIEALNINMLITFDKHGVSQHLNHCSIYYAIAHLSIENKMPPDCTVYVLETVNLLRKYCLIFDLPITYLLSRIRYLLSFDERAIVHQAMRQHQSQLVWYRRIYMLCSRYMLINSLQRMDLSDIELDLELDD